MQSKKVREDASYRANDLRPRLGNPDFGSKIEHSGLRDSGHLASSDTTTTARLFTTGNIGTYSSQQDHSMIRAGLRHLELWSCRSKSCARAVETLDENEHSDSMTQIGGGLY